MVSRESMRKQKWFLGETTAEGGSEKGESTGLPASAAAASSRRNNE